MATQSEITNGIIIGAAAAAIGTIIAFKFIQKQPQGGGQPNQPSVYMQGAPDRNMTVVDLVPTPDGVSPVAQVNPITEAAYNLQPVKYEPAFNTNDATEPLTLPQ